MGAAIVNSGQCLTLKFLLLGARPPILSQVRPSFRVKLTEHPPGHTSRMHRQGRGEAPRLTARGC